MNATTSPKYFMKACLKSIAIAVLLMICFLFIVCMVCKKFIAEINYFGLKYHQIFDWNLSKSWISWFFVGILYPNLENRNRSHYVSKKIYENTFQKYCWFSTYSDSFHIFWMHGLEKIHCGSLFLLFEISSKFDWNPSKS